jgi:hypothetical protein
MLISLAMGKNVTSAGETATLRFQYMKLTHIAHLLTLVLLAITAWLAYQATEESQKANAKMDRLTAQQTALTAPTMQSVTMESDPSLMNSRSTVASAPALPVVSAPAASSLPPPPAAPTPPEPTAASLAAAGAPARPVTLAAPAALTPLQKRVKDAMSLGKVKDVVPEHGFVTFHAPGDVGLKEGQQFDLRRNAAVVGRITISAIEPDAVVANLDPKSVPSGLSVQAGDEIISIIPTH